MKKILIATLTMMLMISFTACSQMEAKEDKSSKIDFKDKQLYAVAYLGYGDDDCLNNMDHYVTEYGLEEDIPVHYFSEGDYYLIIPRYEEMNMKLYENDIETFETTLCYEEEKVGPFVVQCNISDIFTDVTISLTYQEEEVSFSPYISSKDGSVVVGEFGENITK